MSNYYYPAKIKNPADLADGEYGVWGNQLYLNSDGKIGIVKNDKFMFYDDSVPALYKVSCGELSKICCSSILFNVVSAEWVLFKKIANCGNGDCYSVIDKVVCRCDDPESEFCYENIITGFDNQAVGIANQVSGNYNDVRGLYTTVSSESNFIPAMLIEVSGILLATTITPDVYTLTIPGDFVASIICATHLLLTYGGREYQVRISNNPAPTLTGGNTVIQVRKAETCNEVPPMGPIDKVIATAAIGDALNGSGNIDFGMFSLSSGSYNTISGRTNVIQSGSFNLVSGGNNSYSFIFTSTAGTTNIPLTMIIPIDQSYHIAAMNLDTLENSYGTLIRIAGAPDTIVTDLPDGRYSFVFLDAMRITSNGDGTVDVDIILPYLITIAVSSTNPLFFYLNGKLDSQTTENLYWMTYTSGAFRLYNFNDTNANVVSAVPIQDDAYMRLYSGKSITIGEGNRSNGQSTFSLGDRNMVNALQSMAIGFDNVITNAGYGHMAVGRNNVISWPSSRNIMLTGRANTLTTTSWQNTAPADPVSNSVLMVGESNSAISSYSLNVGSGGSSLYPYSLSILQSDRTRVMTIGNLSYNMPSYTGFTGNWVNGIPVLNTDDGNIILNAGSTSIFPTGGLSTATNIFQVIFNKSFTIGGRANQLPARPSSIYRIKLNGSFAINNIANMIMPYFFPTYDLLFRTDASGVIDTNAGSLINNQAVFTTPLVSTLTGATVPTQPTIVIFVNQPDPYFFQLCAFTFASQGGAGFSINGTLDVDISYRTL